MMELKFPKWFLRSKIVYQQGSTKFLDYAKTVRTEHLRGSDMRLEQLSDDRDTYERQLMEASSDCLELARHLHRAAMAHKGPISDVLTGSFVPAPVYMFQATEIMSNPDARAFILKLIKGR